MSEQEDLLTVRDVARICNRTEETVRRWIWSGKLRARKLGNQMFVSRGDLEAMQAPRAGEPRAAYKASGARDRSDRHVMSRVERQAFAAVSKRRKALSALHGAQSIDGLLVQIRRGGAFYPGRPYTKKEKLAALERAVALGKDIRAKYGPVNVSDLIHEIREDNG